MSSPRTFFTGLAAAAGSITLAAVLLTAPGTGAQQAQAATPNPVTPGNFTGRGFDQCNAPTQRAMDAWRADSPFRAVGIYISGASRFCREQPNLTPTWVRTQLAKGWRLLPITLGPQPSCLDRFPRYGKNIDPTVNPDPTNHYAKAKAQGSLEARRAVAAAQNLGIVKRSTLYYDMEGWDHTASTNCNRSALWFMSAWTQQLHRLGYASGVYSSAGSGIRLLDTVRRNKISGFHLPDQLWIARWDGVANTSTSYISDEGWQNQRIKQYRGGHDERHGGVTINIDSNYLDVRTPTLPGTQTTTSPTDPPATTGTYDAACTRASINKRSYGPTSKWTNKGQIGALQCLLKQQGHYNREVTGTWNRYTTSGLHRAQASFGHPQRHYASRSDWTAMLSKGATPATKIGARGADVIRIQRALNAATRRSLPVTGYFGTETRAAVKAYKSSVLGRTQNGIVGRLTWRALQQGRM